LQPTLGGRYIVDDMTSKTSAALWAHHGHVNSRKPKFKTSLERLFGGCGVDHTIYTRRVVRLSCCSGIRGICRAPSQCGELPTTIPLRIVYIVWSTPHPPKSGTLGLYHPAGREPIKRGSFKPQCECYSRVAAPHPYNAASEISLSKFRTLFWRNSKASKALDIFQNS
jgi:hypothetical protein